MTGVEINFESYDGVAEQLRSQENCALMEPFRLLWYNAVSNYFGIGLTGGAYGR